MRGIHTVKLLWIIVLATALLPMATGGVRAGEVAAPSKKDKCPVCGVFVYKYPDWTAEIVFTDGSAEFFDGAKDLFKYYFNPMEYRPDNGERKIEAIYVMEYYNIELIDARKAFFVIGSDVYGPMGHELIPLASQEDAQRFLKDHKGKRILRFDQITSQVIANLDS